MKSFVYQSPRGESVDLNSAGVWVGQILPLRSRSYSYDLGFRRLGVVSQPAREIEVQALSQSPTSLDVARSVFEADTLARTPGTLWINDEWSQRALVVGSEALTANSWCQQVTLRFALLDGVWVREHGSSFNLQVLTEGQDLDYPYDYPHDLAPSALSEELTVPGRLPASIKITMFGPVVNPYVIIGENKYQLNNVTVPSGGYVVVDGREKTIMMTAENGDTQNWFSAGERGTGTGSGSYIFEKVPAGLSTVSWPNSFGFDITVFEESGEVPWQTLR